MAQRRRSAMRANGARALRMLKSLAIKMPGSSGKKLADREPGAQVARDPGLAQLRIAFEQGQFAERESAGPEPFDRLRSHLAGRNVRHCSTSEK